MIAPYFTFARYIRENFRTKAFRISVDGFLGCNGKCIYCENSYYRSPEESLEEQIIRLKEFYEQRYKVRDFYLYFQKGTNTAAPAEELKRLYDKGLSLFPFIGLIIGTRPDAVDKKVISMIESYTSTYDVWVEFGLQSTFNETLQRVRRGHTYEDFLGALDLLKETKIKCTVHMILGLPGETGEMMAESVRRLSRLPIQGIKFHHLYVLDGTELSRLYKEGEYTPLEYSRYKEILIDCLENLRSDIVVHRVLGEDRSGHLLAPRWEVSKDEILADIKKTMTESGRFQGRLFP
ncbi:TIGR01212 family radical SAM protein [Candidatus Mcinerneyibacteriota bacterium]|nr:TIGR01212 family radical SAM protein [Candidatus Mcinerneyibacteriota bacterium]